jgi:hypothetical protein
MSKEVKEWWIQLMARNLGIGKVTATDEGGSFRFSRRG